LKVQHKERSAMVFFIELSLVVGWFNTVG